MFIGHFGAGFAGKKFSKSASLGTYFMAAQWIDLIWPILFLLGIEKAETKPGVSAVTPLDFTYYPFTHSLLGVIIWGILFSAVYFLIRKKLKNALILGALVVSNWFLDLLVHIPDSLVGLIVFLVVMYISNFVDPPTPFIEAIGFVRNAQRLIIL